MIYCILLILKLYDNIKVGLKTIAALEPLTLNTLTSVGSADDRDQSKMIKNIFVERLAMTYLNTTQVKTFWAVSTIFRMTIARVF